MKFGVIALVVASVAIVAGCTQSGATPNVDVRLPESQVGRWTIQRMGKPEIGSEEFIFLDTSTGTVCVLTTSDITSVGSNFNPEVGKIKPGKCGALPN